MQFPVNKRPVGHACMIARASFVVGQMRIFPFPDFPGTAPVAQLCIRPKLSLLISTEEQIGPGAIAHAAAIKSLA